MDVLSWFMPGLKLNHASKRGPKSYGNDPVLPEYSDFSREILNHTITETHWYADDAWR